MSNHMHSYVGDINFCTFKFVQRYVYVVFSLFQQFKHYVNKKGLSLATGLKLKCSALEIDPVGGGLRYCVIKLM